MQNTNIWWWDRAKIRMLKNPPLAPCTLHFRDSGNGSVRLFPETAPNAQNVQTQLEMHLAAEAPLAQQTFDIAQDGLPDRDVVRVMWAEGVKATTAGQRFKYHLDLKGIDDDCDSTSFRVLPPLGEYQRTNIVDLGGPGSGHQAGVAKLLASIAAIGFAGDVVLTYNTKKTKFYGEKFGKQRELADPVESYLLYHAPRGTLFPANGGGIHRLAVWCIPTRC